MGNFTLQLQEFAAKAKEKADDVVGLVVVKIAARLDERSPVGDAKYWKNPPPKGYVGGRFRANWQLGVGSVPGGELPWSGAAGARLDRVASITAEVPEDAAGKVYYLANNVPYAQRIEDGWSRQAPEGLVARTVIEFQDFVRDAVGAVQ